MEQMLTDRIRERAYQIWMESGGSADQNWLQAETEILQTAGPVTPPDRRSKKRARSRRE